MRVRGGVAHLARRFVGSWSRRPPADADVVWAWGHLLPREATLWNRLSVADRRHSVAVARRFMALVPEALPVHIAGALLHDVDKVESDLGTLGRVMATVVGPRTERFRNYHDHEAIGVRLLEEAGSDPATIELVASSGPMAAALRAADDL